MPHAPAPSSTMGQGVGRGLSPLGAVAGCPEPWGHSRTGLFYTPLVVGLHQTRPGWDGSIPLTGPPRGSDLQFSSHRPLSAVLATCGDHVTEAPLSGIWAAQVLAAQWLCTFW